MHEESLVLADDALRTELLPLLIGRVFHYTTPQAYARILSDRLIKSNRAGEFGFTWGQSEFSYFRKLACVCVFDLRSATSEQIEDGLLKCWFLNPLGRNNPVFMLLKESCYERLIPWTAWREHMNDGMVVPYVEAGHPDAISLDDIDQVLIVDVKVAPESEPCSECMDAALSSITGDQHIPSNWKCGSCGAEGKPMIPIAWLARAVRDES